MAFKDKETAKSYYRLRAQNKKDFLAKLKDVPCKDCGLKFHHCVMEFDHVPSRGTKKYCVGNGGNLSLKEGSILAEEIKKCDIVCANCHNIRTFNRAKLV